ncbi:MAG TPA: ATP-binding cassette domain-containing protein [Candidatus Limnocylindria bacterium]|jgi:ABC-2 type transport system ATP-binding protein|nr:ATP-binding cassette domain-containing protein [Candidatus Limnocylindria bacterium]
MTLSPVVEVRGLQKRYGQIEAVRGIDLSVTPGEVFGFLGPNGAGKTTTISILCTLVRKTAGEARVAGIDVDKDPSEVRARIGLVFQDPSLDSQLTGRENLELHGQIYGVPSTVRKQRIRELLEVVELADRADSRVITYSGGMKRRLEIARGVLHHPQVLFLDEPTLGLDPQTRKKIWEYLHAMRKREGVTLFMTTHYMDEAEYCDRIAIIDKGQIAALGTPSELKSKVGGDVITVSVADPVAAAAEIRERFGFVPLRDNGSLRIEVTDGAAFLPRLVRELSVPVETVSLRRPSLDDVFLKLTGHAIREEGASGLDQMRNMARMFGGGRR